jgi:hypothetical protein
VRDAIESEAVRLLEHLDMASSDVLRRPVIEPSVGQQQRIGAARALIGAQDSRSSATRLRPSITSEYGEPWSSLDSPMILALAARRYFARL